MSADKEQATRLADALESGNPSLTMEEAAALLRRWPDSGAPVGYLPAYELDRLQSGHDGRLRSAKLGPSYLDGDVAVYTAPPADAERIAALEREVEALRADAERYRWLRRMDHFAQVDAMLDGMEYHTLDAAIDATRSKS